MEFKQTLQNRHSVRMFTNQVVDRDTIREIIHEAQLAPSWVNSQPYHVYLVVGEALERVRNEQYQLEQKGTKSQSDVPVMPRTEWTARAQQNMAEWTKGLGEAAREMGPAAANS
ncbi:nitroreductase family protein [Limosilactobacillus sp.]|uniref:nitroreductase family protein n=1 Tax=Limosilactobacillus sp. TaxID=2773925 RepID=UPI003F086301